MQWVRLSLKQCSKGKVTHLCQLILQYLTSLQPLFPEQCFVSTRLQETSFGRNKTSIAAERYYEKYMERCSQPCRGILKEFEITPRSCHPCGLDPHQVDFVRGRGDSSPSIGGLCLVCEGEGFVPLRQRLARFVHSCAQPSNICVDLMASGDVQRKEFKLLTC